jgi:anti-sigma factor RsiW
LTEREIAELCALADGTLPAERRAEVEARVAASPELLELVERQRRAVAATQALSAESPPASLEDSIAALRRRRDPRRSRGGGLVPRLAFAGGLAAAVAVVAVVFLTGGPGGPTVAEAAELATKPPNAPAPVPSSSPKLALGVEGVAFPNLAYRTGWEATGVRHGRIDGRNATVVSYQKNGRTIAYVIVAGAGLPRPSQGQTTSKGGVQYQTLRLNGRLAITWRRGGHTCVLIGDAKRPELLELASWPFTQAR